jgi:hypothetical protein
MEAIRSSETSVHTRSKRRHIQEDGILHNHRCESLKSYETKFVAFSLFVLEFVLFPSLLLVILKFVFELLKKHVKKQEAVSN